MRRLVAFIITSVDRYFEGPNREFDWPNLDEAFFDFSVSQLDDIDVPVFGRTTYEGMAAYRPTDEARAAAPAIAERMNRGTHFSSSKASWQPGVATTP